MSNTDEQMKTSKRPKQAFDTEYSTQFRKQAAYLKEHGIEPSFVKKTKDYGVTVYKYTKTPELFRAVANFYEDRRNEKEFAALQQMTDIARQYSDFVDSTLPQRIFGIQEVNSLA